MSDWRADTHTFLNALIRIPDSDLDAFADQLDKALGGGDVAAVQIRLKPASDEQIREIVDRELAARPDVAARAGPFRDQPFCGMPCGTTVLTMEASSAS